MMRFAWLLASAAFVAMSATAFADSHTRRNTIALAHDESSWLAPGQQQTVVVVPPITTELVMLHGTNNGTGIDPRVGKIPALVKPPFSAYNSYELLKRETVPLALAHATSTKLPNHGDLVVTYQGVLPATKTTPKKYVVNLSIQRHGSSILPLLQVNANAGETLFAAVPGYKGGVLVVGLKILP